MAHGSAELLEGDVLTGDGLHDIGPRDEHVARLVHHEDEVRHRRGIDGAAGTRTENDADLWHDPGRADVPVEDPAIAVQRDHALLDACPARIVEADDRHADRERKIHDLVDLLGVRFAERPPEHGEILAEHADAPLVDRPEACDHPVCVRAGALEAHAVRPVPDEQVHLLERILVEQVVDPLTGRHLALGLVRLDRTLRSRVDRLRPPGLKSGKTGAH